MSARRFLQSLFLLMLFIFIIGCRASSIRELPKLKATRGILDLKSWQFARDGIIDLSGEYEFYWRKQIPPTAAALQDSGESGNFMQVPGIWNGKNFAGQKLPGEGFATYRLTIYLNEKTPLAFKFLDMGTAFTFFVNGHELTHSGKAGRDRASSEPAYDPHIVTYQPESDRLDVTIWVSNFHHKKGGIWEKIQLGLEKEIRAKRDSRVFTDIFLFSSIFVIGLYHILLNVLRNRDKPSLYFGICCLLISMRRLLIGEIYFHEMFPAISWSMLCRLEYLTIFWAVPFFALFFYSLYREDFIKFILHAIIAIAAILSVIVVFFPVRIFSHTIPVFHVYLILSCLYAFYLLVRSILHKREGARILLAGFIILFLAVVNDILEYTAVLHSREILAFGQLAFIGSLTVLIAYRFSNAFKTVDRQRIALANANEQIQHELHERKVTEEENLSLQEKLVRAQKMETIGLLAGGVAHDLNNILSGIVSYPDLLLKDLKKGTTLHGAMETIKKSGLKAAAVVQDLLTLARRGVINFEPVNLNLIINEYLYSPEYYQFKMNHPAVSVVSDLDKNAANILGSSAHLRTVIMNLVANAFEAQPKGGEIIISTENRYVDQLLKVYEEIPEGTYVLCRIKDIGTGIAAENLQQIFEPFYTKKVMGRSGTGLGMPVVWGIVHDHNGFIDVRSDLHRGTTFELYFPATKKALAPEDESIPMASYSGNGEKILIVDDVEEQRLIGREILQRLNYEVATVSSGEEAVEFVQSKHVDLVLLDMVMDPGIDGFETYSRIVALKPDTKAIIASGFSETDRVRETQKLGAGKYIRKPYTFEKIGLAVYQELHKKAE